MAIKAAKIILNPVKDLAGVTLLCYWAIHFTLAVPLSTQVPANTNILMLWSN